MLKVDIVNDDSFGSCFVTLLSGMLPHERYEPEYFGEIINRVLNIVNIEEMQMEYYVLFASLEQVYSMMLNIPDSITSLTREGLDLILQTQIDGLVHKPELGLKDWLLSQGMPDDLKNELVLANAKQDVYARTMDLYDRAFQMQLSGSEALSTLPAFKNAFLANVSETAMNIQRSILEGSMVIGREQFTSVQGWLEYIGLVAAECDIRLTDDDENVFHVNDASKTAALEKALASMFEGLAEYGIAPLDDATPMMRHVLDVVTANEGVGKTTFALHSVGNVITSPTGVVDEKRGWAQRKLNGNKIAYMCGESHKALIWAKMLINYIYHTRGKFFSTAHITGKVEVSEANKQLIALAKMELEEAGCILLVGAFKYRTVYREIKKIYDAFKFDALFIDHSGALIGHGNDMEKASMLSVALREFKKNYPVYIMVLAHLSAIAKELVAKGKQVNSAPAKGGGALSNEADDVFILLKDAVLAKTDMLYMEVYKRRNGPPITQKIVLEVMSKICVYKYDKRHQQGVDNDSISAKAALERVRESLGDVDEENMYTQLGFAEAAAGSSDYDDEDDDLEWEDPDEQE